MQSLASADLDNHLIGPPPGPAPRPAGLAGLSVLSLRDLCPRGGEGLAPVLAVLLTSSILLTTLALYIAVCVAVFALF